ncbi:family 31 glycoside hydrolase, partial [Mycena olivaceomarginata]
FIQHNSDTSISQEFYRWALTTQAAQNTGYSVCRKCLGLPPMAYSAIPRYRLLDYFYTAFHEASLQGTPVVSPWWFKYPKDTVIYPIDLQWFFSDSILVSPV